MYIRMESLCHVEADRYIGYVHYVYTRVWITYYYIL